MPITSGASLQRTSFTELAEGRDVLQRIARLAIAAPRRIVAIAVLVLVAAGVFGIPVAKSLSAGGFQSPTSESAQAKKLLVDKFGLGDMELIISVTSDAGAQG